MALPSCKFKAEVGSAVLFDYRLHHRGLANRSTSGESRPLLYLTFGRSWFTDAENFPAFFLFKEGTAADGTPIKFDGDVTTNGLKRFVTAETGIWIGLAGTLEAFDKIAARFPSTAADLVRPTHSAKASVARAPPR